MGQAIALCFCGCIASFARLATVNHGVHVQDGKWRDVGPSVGKAVSHVVMDNGASSLVSLQSLDAMSHGSRSASPPRGSQTPAPAAMADITSSVPCASRLPSVGRTLSTDKHSH